MNSWEVSKLSTLLQNKSPRAWGQLLRSRPPFNTIRVETVHATELTPTQTRYELQIVDHNDPITLLAKQCSPIEARFFADLSAEIPDIAPHCWLSYTPEEKNEQSWIVLADTPHDRPTKSWSESDVSNIITGLAHFHLRYWNQSAELGEANWLPQLLKSAPHVPHDLPKPKEERLRAQDDWQEKTLSTQAKQSIGRLNNQWEQAALGLRAILELDGWQGVMDERHLRAFADLIDDPLPMLFPLRQLPRTLLHGNPGIYNWRVSGLGAYQLTNWKQISIGSSVYDLAIFLESFELLHNPKSLWTLREEWPMTEEGMIDTYLLTMTSAEELQIDARALRQAIPAARCLHILLTWLPRFHRWFSLLPDNKEARIEIWREITQYSDEELAQTMYRPIAGLRPYMRQSFQRFLRSYYQLF